MRLPLALAPFVAFLLIALAFAPAPAAAYELVFQGGSPATVDEGDSLMVTVQVNPIPGCSPWMVDWMVTINDLGTDPSDYGTPPSTINFTDASPSAVIFIPTVDDAVAEGTEAFEIDLTPGANSSIDCLPEDPDAPNYTLLVEIIDNDFAAPTLSIVDIQASEGDSGTQTLLVDVLLDNPPATGIVSVDYTTVDGTATAASGDYAAESGTVAFDLTMASSRRVTLIEQISIQTNGDTLPEPNETFTIELSNSSGPTIVDPTGVVTLLNDDFVTPSFRVDDVQVLEGDDGPESVFLTVTLDNPDTVNGFYTVDYETFDRTATQADGDFLFTAGTLTFDFGGAAAGRRVDQTVEVTYIGDTKVEPDEFFELVLDNPTGGAIIADNKGNITLLNDDQPAEPPIEASITDARVVEGTGPDTPATFTVTLSEPSTRPLRVRYTTVPDSATGDDFRATSGALDFAPGEQQKEFVIAIVGDALEEPDERFFVDLSSQDPVIFFRDRRGVGVIVDDDAVVAEPASLKVEPVTVTEGDAGTRDAVFVVTLDPPQAETVTVQVATRDGSATAGSDYQARTGGLVFAPGEIRKAFPVPVRGDTEFEPDEIFFLDLSNPDGADLAVASAEGTITNDDQEITELPSISIGDAQITEGDVGTTAIRFDLTLDRASETPVTVSFSTRDGSATAGADYESRTDSVTLPPGTTSATLAVLVGGDTIEEDNETFFVDLSDPIGAELGRASGQATILDDDEADDTEPPAAASALRLLRPDAAIEGQGPATVVVERTGMPETAAQVTVSTASGTAVEGRDFQAIDRIVRWAPGETGPRTVEIPIVDDNRREGEESFRVALRAASGSDLVAPTQTTVTILDDDLPVRLVPVGETTRQANVRETLELAVRVLRDGDIPVAGAVVAFGVENGLLEGDGRGESDDDGIVRQQVTLRRTPGLTTVRARLVGTDAAVEFTIEVRGNLTDDVGGPGDEGQQDLAGVLDQACVDATGELSQLCDFLFDLDSSSERRRALEALTPRRLAAQNRALLRAPRAQTQNVDTRLRALRTGAPRASVFDQLALSLRGESMTIGALRKGAARPTDLEEQKALARRVDLALVRAAPDGARGPDRASSGVLGRAAADDDGARNDRRDEFDGPATRDSDTWAERDRRSESPWGLFVNGRVAIGDSPREELDADFDVEIGGLTAGVDYRIDDRWIVGLALGGVSTRTELARQRGGTDVDSLSVSLYGSYTRDALWIDAVLGLGTSEYEIRRVIDLPGPFQGQNTATAVGTPDGEQVSADLGLGYDWAHGAWTIGGFGRLSWVDLTVDSYAETGAGPFRLGFAEQTSESLQAEAGVELARAISLSWGVMQPQVRLSYLQELENDPVELRSRLVSDPAARVFRVLARPADRSFFNLEAALSATFRRGWAGFFQFDTDLARDDLDLYTLSGGFRVQF